jgi:phosphoglycolate phosphatase-like HAD superfamily hydrolase
VVGDTVWDIEMALRACVGAIAVGWGYHMEEVLLGAGAHALAATREDLLGLIDARLAAQERQDAQR